MDTVASRWRQLLCRYGLAAAGAILAAGGVTPTLSGAQTMVTLDPRQTLSLSGADDLQRLQHLASGVGWEFEPNEATSTSLKRLGFKAIRCINVDPLPGAFAADGSFQVGQPDRLLAHLATCRAVGAAPHIIIAQSLHPDLRLTAEDIPADQRGTMGNQTAQAVFGPRDRGRFQRYCEAYFDYVLVRQGFAEARFEVANEPDIGGGVHPRPPKPANGTRALYEGYLELYRDVAAAAARFEGAHPGLRVCLGGPALAWAFTFRYGELNWADRFLQDCAEQKLKLDFLGIHFYGNIAALRGEYPTNYPSFVEMLGQTKASRDRWLPGLPVWLTEWGPSYHTANDPKASPNASHLGAAWSMDFLNTLLEQGVAGALYLVTTDLRQQRQDGAWETVWGWPSLFANPNALGQVWPKAPCHVFDMISRLRGQRIAATVAAAPPACFAVADPASRRVQAVLWNYRARLPESEVPVEQGRTEEVRIVVLDAGSLFGGRTVRARRWLVSEDTSNAYPVLVKGGTPDASAELQPVQDERVAVRDGRVALGFALPPSSVTLVEIAAE